MRFFQGWRIKKKFCLQKDWLTSHTDIQWNLNAIVYIHARIAMLDMIWFYISFDHWKWGVLCANICNTDRIRITSLVNWSMLTCLFVCVNAQISDFIKAREIKFGGKIPVYYMLINVYFKCCQMLPRPHTTFDKQTNKYTKKSSYPPSTFLSSFYVIYMIKSVCILLYVLTLEKCQPSVYGKKMRLKS